MNFTIGYKDLLLVIIVGIANSWFIGFIQKRQPFPTGIIDFAIRKEKNIKLNKYYIFFILPFLTGIILGFLSISPFLSGLSSALGMFLCVATAFTNPKMLAPPLQEKLFKARITYFILILMYFTASTVGNALVAIMPYIDSVKNDSYRTGLLANLSTFIIGAVFTFALNIILKNNVKAFEPSDEMIKKILYEQEQRLTKNVRYIIGEELNDSLYEIADKISASVDRDNMERMKEIVKGEVANNIAEIGTILNLAIEQEIIRRNRDSSRNIIEHSNYNYYSNYQKNYVQSSYANTNERIGYGYYGERTIKRIYPRYFN
jgi:hypothetical protein